MGSCNQALLNYAGVHARPLRIELETGSTSRGAHREAIYRNDQDSADWLGVAGAVCARFYWRCHAYCEMTDHVHFVAETAAHSCWKSVLSGVISANLSRGAWTLTPALPMVHLLVSSHGTSAIPIT